MPPPRLNLFIQQKRVLERVIIKRRNTYNQHVKCGRYLARQWDEVFFLPSSCRLIPFLLNLKAVHHTERTVQVSQGGHMSRFLVPVPNHMTPPNSCHMSALVTQCASPSYARILAAWPTVTYAYVRSRQSRIQVGRSHLQVGTYLVLRT